MQCSILKRNSALGIVNYTNNFVARQPQNYFQAITGSDFVVPAKKSFQFAVGASRRRAAPRSQSSDAAHLA